jgi:hypothetical protein
LPPRARLQVRESLRGATVDALVERHPLKPAIEEASAQARQLGARLPSLRGMERGLGHRQVA